MVGKIGKSINVLSWPDPRTNPKSSKAQLKNHNNTQNRLVVKPTHLKNMLVKLDHETPRIGVKTKTTTQRGDLFKAPQIPAHPQRVKRCPAPRCTGLSKISCCGVCTSLAKHPTKSWLVNRDACFMAYEIHYRRLT